MEASKLATIGVSFDCHRNGFKIGFVLFSNVRSQENHSGKWCAEFSEECHTKAQQNPDAPNDLELMKENLRLRKELEEAKKENLFLKKAAAFFAKEID